MTYNYDPNKNINANNKKNVLNFFSRNLLEKCLNDKILYDFILANISPFIYTRSLDDLFHINNHQQLPTLRLKIVDGALDKAFGVYINDEGIISIFDCCGSRPIGKLSKVYDEDFVMSKLFKFKFKKEPFNNGTAYLATKDLFDNNFPSKTTAKDILFDEDIIVRSSKESLFSFINKCLSITRSFSLKELSKTSTPAFNAILKLLPENLELEFTPESYEIITTNQESNYFYKILNETLTLGNITAIVTASSALALGATPYDDDHPDGGSGGSGGGSGDSEDGNGGSGVGHWGGDDEGLGGPRGCSRSEQTPGRPLSAPPERTTGSTHRYPTRSKTPKSCPDFKSLKSPDSSDLSDTDSKTLITEECDSIKTDNNIFSYTTKFLYNYWPHILGTAIGAGITYYYGGDIYKYLTSAESSLSVNNALPQGGPQPVIASQQSSLVPIVEVNNALPQGGLQPVIANQQSSLVVQTSRIAVRRTPSKISQNSIAVGTTPSIDPLQQGSPMDQQPSPTTDFAAIYPEGSTSTFKRRRFGGSIIETVLVAQNVSPNTGLPASLTRNVVHTPYVRFNPSEETSLSRSSLASSPDVGAPPIHEAFDSSSDDTSLGEGPSRNHPVTELGASAEKPKKGSLKRKSMEDNPLDKTRGTKRKAGQQITPTNKSSRQEPSFLSPHQEIAKKQLRFAPSTVKQRLRDNIDTSLNSLWDKLFEESRIDVKYRDDIKELFNKISLYKIKGLKSTKRTTINDNLKFNILEDIKESWNLLMSKEEFNEAKATEGSIDEIPETPGPKASKKEKDEALSRKEEGLNNFSEKISLDREIVGWIYELSLGRKPIPSVDSKFEYLTPVINILRDHYSTTSKKTKKKIYGGVPKYVSYIFFALAGPLFNSIETFASDVHSNNNIDSLYIVSDEEFLILDEKNHPNNKNISVTEDLSRNKLLFSHINSLNLESSHNQETLSNKDNPTNDNVEASLFGDQIYDYACNVGSILSSFAYQLTFSYSYEYTVAFLSYNMPMLDRSMIDMTLSVIMNPSIDDKSLATYITVKELSKTCSTYSGLTKQACFIAYANIPALAESGKELLCEALPLEAQYHLGCYNHVDNSADELETSGNIAYPDATI